tara:strand:- start:8 stop:328 length:321 start_codon:yes stop_codon:yes gene_type:complete
MSDLLGVGDEVVCIDNSYPSGWSVEDFPQWVLEGSKYTIREILDNDDIVVGVLLVELENPSVFQELLGRDQEGAFASWRFSKLRSAYDIREEKEHKKIVKGLRIVE